MTVFLLTHGDGSDGDAWKVLGIFSTEEKAKIAKANFERPRPRPDGSAFTLEAIVEPWDVDCGATDYDL